MTPSSQVEEHSSVTAPHPHRGHTAIPGAHSDARDEIIAELKYRESTIRNLLDTLFRNGHERIEGKTDAYSRGYQHALAEISISMHVTLQELNNRPSTNTLELQGSSDPA